MARNKKESKLFLIQKIDDEENDDDGVLFKLKVKWNKSNKLNKQQSHAECVSHGLRLYDKNERYEFNKKTINKWMFK